MAVTRCVICGEWIYGIANHMVWAHRLSINNPKREPRPLPPRKPRRKKKDIERERNG